MKITLKGLIGGFVCFVPAFSLQNLELINAQSAWNQGITGQGVKIGIIDTGFDIVHPALKNQFINLINSNNLTHGTGVASVAVGAKIGNNPHGVAYRAKFYGLPFHGYDAYRYFKDKDIKVINNSWGYSIFPVIKLHIKEKQNGTQTIQNLDGLDDPQTVLDFVKNNSYDHSLFKLAQEKNILSIVSTGNSGMSSASITATLPRYDESLRSWLAAGALDASYISKNNSGQLVLQSKALADFSNGFRGIELFGISAPGVNVSVATLGGGYGKSNGTSFSSPLISGAAALVLEKFPFLNGAQVADILLSTANKDYITPKVVLKEEDINNISRYTIIYIDHKGNRPNQNQIKQDLRNAGYENYIIEQAFNHSALEGESNRVLFLNREEVFGQGILDIQKALGGIALLDANRLNQKDIYTIQNKKEVLLYSIDTQAHNATFNNNIAQRKWEIKYHHPQANNTLPQSARNLDVGLLKKGNGKLELLGENSYKGITFINQGTLALNKRSDGSGGVLESKIFIDNQGKLQGNGIIKNDVVNDGILSPGNADFDTLTIQGNYTHNQKATLEIHFGIEETRKITAHSNGVNADSVATTKDHAKLKANSYTIHGGTLLYTPIKSRFYINGEEILITLDDALKNQVQHFSLITIQTNASQTIDFYLRDRFTILIGKKQNAYFIPEIKSDLHKALQTISSNPHLPKKYKNYFAFIDSATKPQYIDALKSLDGDLYLQNTKEILNNQSRLSLSDITLLLQHSNEDKILFTPSFAYMKDLEYRSYIFSLDVQGRKKITNDISLSGFLNFSNFQTNDEFSKLSSQVFSGELSLSYDLKAIEIFGGIGAGFGYNTFKKESVPLSTGGNYLNALGFMHLGFGKTYKFQSFTLMPLIWIQNLYVYQDAWKETSNVFGKSYSIAHYNVLDASTGLRLGYEENFFSFGFFGYYTRHLLGNPLKNQTSFFDFPTQIIHQCYTSDSNAYKVGVDFSYTPKTFLMSIKLDSDLAKNFWGIRASLALGTKF